MPSSFGSQWRLLRHYLKQNGSPEQLEHMLRRLEKAISWRLSARPIESELNNADSVVGEQRSDAVRPAAILRAEPTHTGDSQANIADRVNVNSPKDGVTKTLTTSEENVAEQGIHTNGREALADNSATNNRMGNFMDGIKLRTDLALGRISQYKQAGETTTRSSVHARTAYVITALVTAETRDSVRTRTRSLIEHITQYPEARDYAIKEGGVRALLRVENRLDAEDSRDKEIYGLVQEALALLGHVGPCKGPGPNVLSLDGGGIRGLIAIEILKQLERLSGRKVGEMFDYIVGVSTGAIIAAVIGSGVGNLDTASDMYHTLSKQMFGNTSVLGGTSRLVFTHSYYDTQAWEKMLQDRVTDISLTHCNNINMPKMCLVSCVVNRGSRLSPFLFRSYSLPYRVRSCFPGTSKALVWQAVRASAAAPTYFEEFHHDGLIHQDGGIMVNNPCGIALHEARLLYGPQQLQQGCVVSIGTGRVLNKQLEAGAAGATSAATSWKDKFNKILDSATDTEGVHQVLNDLLPEGSYFRLNPPLNAECAMDEIDPDKLNSLLLDTRAYMLRNRHKLQQAARMLTRRRPLARRLADSLRHRAHLMGVRQAY